MLTHADLNPPAWLAPARYKTVKPHIDYKVLVRAWNNYKPKADPDDEVRLTIRVHSNKDGRIERRTAMKYATEWLQENAPRRVSSFVWIQSFHPGTHEEA